MQAPEPPTTKTQNFQSKTPIKNKAPMGQRLFGDTLTKSHQNAVRNVLPDRVIKPKETKEVSKQTVTRVIPIPAKPAQMSKINPLSYLRRERTFDMTLMQPDNKEKFKPKFSPQFQRKTYNEPSKPVEIRPMTTQERYRANNGNRSSTTATTASTFQSELRNATKVRQSLAAMSNEKMQTFDKRLLKKPAPVHEVTEQKSPAKAPLEKTKSSENSAMSNPTMSASSSFKYSKPKEPEIVQYHRHGEEIISPRESVSKDETHNQMNNFYFGMKEASVDTDNEDENEVEQAQMEAINRFAENIFKMGRGGDAFMPNNQGKLGFKFIKQN